MRALTVTFRSKGERLIVSGHSRTGPKGKTRLKVFETDVRAGETLAFFDPGFHVSGGVRKSGAHFSFAVVRKL